MSSAPSHLRVGIIGAGMIGEPLARLLTEAGHSVKIANSRGPETLADLAQRTGATAATAESAVKDAQLVVVTIPQKAVPQLGATRLISTLSKDVIVIETGNYYTYRDGNIAELDSESITESEWVQQHLGHPVIKLFNNIGFHSLSSGGKPTGTPDRIALPLFGDDAAQKATVVALLYQIGFDAVDGGGLSESWRAQPGSPVYVCDYDVAGVKKALARADRSRTHEVQAVQLQALMAAMADKTPLERFTPMARELMAKQYPKRD